MAGIAVIAILLLGVFKPKNPNHEKRIKDLKSPKNKRISGSGNVDAQFFERIKHLLKIVIPGFNSKEFKYVTVLTLLLVLRTQMSIWLADVNGKIVKAIVE
jgi:ATP-binding cassette, subfamily D (ALD), peroxisomal long-chain fatty acid import protein